jgi:hypothetical protein
MAVDDADEQTVTATENRSGRQSRRAASKGKRYVESSDTEDDDAEVGVGDSVNARWQGGQFCAGRIKAVNADKTFVVEYDDGLLDHAVPAAHIKRAPKEACSDGSKSEGQARKRKNSSSHDHPPKQARSGPKADGRSSLEKLAVRTYIEKQPTSELLSKRIGLKLFDKLLDIGLKCDGNGLKNFAFEDGPMLNFCTEIAHFNRTNLKHVKMSKMKMLETWQNVNDEFYFLSDPADAKSPNNITLTVKGKHSLLMHIDTKEAAMSHELESIFRNLLSGLITEAAAEFCCRHLPKHVETANHNFDNIRVRHLDIKEEQRQQRHLIMTSQGKTEAQASRCLQGATRLLSQGLFPKKKLPDGSPSDKTYSAVEMAMMANPGTTKPQIFRKSVTSFANEPVLHAMSLQRSAVTYRMSKKKEDYFTAHQKVGGSGGMDLMRLFGLDEDDPEAVAELADLSYNKVAGIEHFGQRQLAGAQEVGSRLTA